MITLEQVNLQYAMPQNQSFHALKEINLTIAPGERLAVIGPSGCGKSSMLNLMAGLIKPTSGRVFCGGTVMDKPSEDISIILQEYGLFPWKTVEQNIALPLILKKKDKKQTHQAVKEMLDSLGLSEHKDKYTNQLSGGQRQRVAIGRALVCHPKVLLMDEPFSALDALTRENLQNMILEICEQQQLTLVLVTHNIEEAVFLGGRIAVFGNKQGEIASVVDNQHSGQLQYRNTMEFYQQCSALRCMLKGVGDEK